MNKQNDNSARGVEVGTLLSTEETRKLWKEYQAGTLDKWMYGDLPLGWSQVVSKAQAVLTRQETAKLIFGEIEWLLDMTDDEFGFIEISNHCPYSAFQFLKERWLK